MIKNTIFNWSTGKDSALGLYKLQQDPQCHVTGLLTSVNSHFDRVSMHGVRRELLAAQAKAIGLPLHCLEIPESPSMEVYEGIMRQNLEALKLDGMTHAAFGDIFLQDLRDYREQKLKEMSIEGLFPLWQKDTKALMAEFLGLGFKSVITCVNLNYLDESFVGRVIDAQFVADLPSGVDVCGEYGEYHSFCFDGPIFEHPIAFALGEKVHKTYPQPQTQASGTACDSPEVKPQLGFCYIDLLPG
jgi:uncharacterized protein (TIGR00290 family)